MANPSQGEINAVVTRLADKPDELREYMRDKPESKKRLARSHLKTVMALRGKKK